MNFIRPSQNAGGIIRQISNNCISKHTSSIRPSLLTQSKYSVKPFTRSLVSSTSSKINLHNQQKHTLLCSNACSLHTKGDKELVDFLQQEISSEKGAHTGPIASKLDDFSIKQNKAELVLTKKFHDEDITISLNVNHTVAAEDSLSENAEQQATEEDLTSRPDFEVDIKIGSKVLSFTCQFSPPEEISEGDQVQDNFGISEFTIYEGEWDEDVYCASGDILDGVMYDLLMNMLEERGISNQFAAKLSDLSTSYEHGLYINLLEKVQNFIQRK